MSPKAVLVTDRLPDPDALGSDPLSQLEIIKTIWTGEGSREGVVPALQHLARGEAEVLVAARLGLVAASLSELVDLLAWLERGGGRLVALAPPFDSAGDRATVAVLEEVAGWERAGHPARKRKGRPGLAEQAPELFAYIHALREQGLGLKAIAERLNEDGYRTPRGGKRWRPSSVQAALGYRRPPPHLRGAPPPPPPGHHPGPPPPPPDRPGGERRLP